MPNFNCSKFGQLVTRLVALVVFAFGTAGGIAQVTTAGFQNLPRTEAPGTLLSHPVDNGSEPIGRTTSLNYLNGWLIVGGEAPGSRPGSDLVMRLYDISDPVNPVARVPSDFGLSYPNNRWYQGNMGWNAHGSAQHESFMLPSVLQVDTFGGIPEMGGTNGIPELANFPLGYNRASQAGPWLSTLLWYDSPDREIEIQRPQLNQWGYVEFQTIGNFDLVGEYGGGDWHPMFFGDLLIYARSGAAARDGVVVYRLEYQNFEDEDRSNDTVVPHYVGSLDGGFHGYWPNLFSDGTGLYVIGSTTDILIGADITDAADPEGEGAVTVAATMTVPGFTNASYPAYQDQYGFIHNRKVDMTRFLSGDPNSIVLTLDEDATGVNTSQISLPVGNLWLTGGYPIPGFNQGMGIWVHQQEADTTPPRVTYHIPQTNRENYPRFAPLSFLVHEHTRAGGPRNGIDFAVRPVLEEGGFGEAVSGFLIHDFSGNLTFTPEDGLAAETTYQVDFFSDPGEEIGFQDAAGNYIEPYSFRFSTGGGIDAVAPPSFDSLTSDNFHPAPEEEITVTASASGSDSLEYRFNFDGDWGEWGSSASASFTYTAEGRPRVIAQVRGGNGSIATDSLRLAVIEPIPEGPSPTQSSTLAIGDDAGERRLWVVNPDSGTVSVLDASTGEMIAEHAVGKNPRSVARDSNGRYWVTCYASDDIHILNADGSLFHQVLLDYGSGPFGVVASPDGESVFVSLYNASQVQRYSADTPSAMPVTTNTVPTPRALAVSADGERLFVTRFISSELEGDVAEFDADSASLDQVRIIHLSSANTHDRGDRSAGVPNYLAGVAISPDGSRAAVVSKQDNTQRGLIFGVDDLTHETTVRAVISFIDLETNEEIRHTRRDFDNSDSPSAVTYTPLGDTILVSLQGNNRLVGIDALNIDPVSERTIHGATETSPAIVSLDVGTGLAPQGVLVDPQSQRVFTQDFMDRTVTVLDAAPLIVENRTTLPQLAKTNTVENELLEEIVLNGKQIFYNAADTRMSADGYISCASCHVDGGTDARIWDFTGRGEGLRRTTDLRGRSGMGHGNVHWSGNFDEIHDFEHDMRGPFGGDGFIDITPQEFALQHPSPASGKTGLSTDLDALAAYVASLGNEEQPRSPHRESDGTFTDAALRGREIFNTQSCVDCHSGDALSNSGANPVASHELEDVGSHSMLSGTRLGGNLVGIDTPTLHGLHSARSFLHHGQVESLAEVFEYAGGVMLTSEDGEFLTQVDPNAVGTQTDEPSEGGGGNVRGALTGTWIYLVNDPDADEPLGVRYSNVDGGANGGPARISIRYLKQYANDTATLTVNGVSQQISLLRQYPDNSWNMSGWRWLSADVELNPGTNNTIELFRTGNDFSVSGVLVSNSEVLARAAPHRRVLDLPTDDRADLMEYLLQLDGRDETGTPFADPAPPEAEAPSVVTAPEGVTLAAGNRLQLTVAVRGTGPFTYQWYRGETPVGADSPNLELLDVTPNHAGLYSVTITNEEGSVSTEAVQVNVNPPLSITSESLPIGLVGALYSASLEANGGISTRSWRIADGTLPRGLSLSADGQIQGTPETAAQSLIRFEVSDDSGVDTRDLNLSIQPAGGFDPDEDLLLHYSFDEGEGSDVWDLATGGNNHSTEVESALWVEDGRFGGAFGSTDLSQEFDAFIPEDQSDLHFDPRSDAYTFSAWVRTTSESSYNVIFGKDGGDPDVDQLRVWTIDGGNSLQAAVAGQYSRGIDLTSRPINDGEWHMVTLVNEQVDGSWQSTLYYDGGELSLSFSSGSREPTDALLRIGSVSAGWNRWRGQIDDVRIYQRALNTDEVAELYSPTPRSGFETWMATVPSPPQDRDPEDDPDGDGLNNLKEYLFGSDPMDASDAPHPSVSMSTDGILSYQLRTNSNAQGYQIIVESSTDLETWAVLANSINGSAFSGAGIIELDPNTPRLTSIRTDNQSGGVIFYRSRIEPVLVE